MRQFLLSLFLLKSFFSFCQVDFNFEDGSLSGWLQVPASCWQASTNQPINDIYSLKHSFNNSLSSIDRISTSVPVWNLNSGTVTWRFKVRYGYDPSSSNCWWVYLMSDLDATAMGSTATTSGYLVGVNFTSSDDLLKIWSINTGVSQIVLTSTFNWQTSMGTTGIGAIEVERSAEGTFTLRASTDGDFSALQELGNIQDVDFTIFNHFGICYKYSSSADQLLWVDDIRIEYQPKNQHDLTSQVILPSTQIPAGVVSSIDTSKNQSMDVFKFIIQDFASGDNLPTRVKKFVIKQDAEIAQADWVNSIAGIKLYSSSGEVMILNTTISNTRITVEVDSTTLIVPDGENQEFTLGIYLNPKNLDDNSLLRFYIDSADHGFISGLSGSGFKPTFNQRVYSNTFTIDVVSTQINLVDYPEVIGINKLFALSVQGTDVSGNLDKSFNKLVTLSVPEGMGTLSSMSGLSKNAENGVAQWNDLKYNFFEPFVIKAECTGFPDSTTNYIEVVNDSSALALPPTSQPLGANISSLSTFPVNAVEVIRFKLADQGLGDGVPTYISRIKLSRTEIENIALLSKSIQGILVKSNGVLVGFSTPEIKTNYIEIPFSQNSLIIPDGNSIEISVFVYLQESGLIDNQKIQLQVDAVDHGFLAYPEGSIFAPTFPQSIISNTFTISVNAQKLAFLNLPGRVGVSEPFDIDISAVDENGNVDLDFNGDVTISLSGGSGVLTMPEGATGQIINGKFQFESLSYDTAGSFSLFISNPNIDDAVSPLIICGDSDGGIFSEVSPIKRAISSIATEPNSAVELFNLNIFDGGATDGQPLIVEKIRLNCFKPSDISEISKLIEGFVIKQNNINVSISSITLANDAFEIAFPVGDLIIPDADTVELSISVYLKKGGLTDKTTFQLYIPSSNHGWISNSTGTAFADEFSSIIFSNECEIKVDANQLRFIESPFATAYPQSITLLVASTDVLGNVDVDFEDDVTLALAKGTGFSTANSTFPLISGKTKWDDVILPKPGLYQFKASGIQLQDGFSEAIFCGINHTCIIDEGFETSISPEWLGITDWQTSTISSIEGIKSLQHKIKGTDGISNLSIPFEFPTQGDKLIEWGFTIRNGDWDPSSDNYFYFVLMSDASNMITESSKGFAVGIDPKSGNDLLTLWQFEGGQNRPLIVSNFDWNESNEITIRIGYTTKGEWMLWYKVKEDIYFTYAGKSTALYSSGNGWCGLVFGYTASRSGLLWMDNLKICVSDYPPLIKSAKPLNLTNTELYFTEPVNHTQATTKSNYQIEDLQRNSIQIQSIDHNISIGNKAIIKTDPLPFGKLKLYVDGVGDLSGKYIKDSINFGLGGDNSIGRLVINEIMANPIPSVGLPEYEYIELYNPSEDTIFIGGWELQYNDKFVKLPSDTILPKQFIVLCSNSAVAALSQFGEAIGVTSFPSLTNSGLMMKLFDQSGSLISFVNYSDNWYGDDSKKNGGWSLERIDYTNLAEGKPNWKASNSTTGGTPCDVNSVVSTNPDNTAPNVLSMEVLSENEILIHFTEPMDTLMLTHLLNYQADNGLGNPMNAKLEGEIYEKVQLTFGINFNPDLVYNICIDEDIQDFSGNHILGTCLQFTLPQIPQPSDIVINEILFNPYTGGVDFVEIYNRSQKCFDISKLMVGNRNLETGQIEQVNPASDTAILLFPSEYAVITTDPKLVTMFYSVQNPQAFCWVSRMASFNTDEGYPVLLNQNFEVVDEMHYTEKMHFSLIEDVKGVSLERISPELPSSNSSTWHSAAQSAGFATPTYKNSQVVESIKVDDEFTISPETFSPNSDGKDDILLINFKLPVEGYVASIKVFSSSGREICRIASNLLLGTEGSVSWDGLGSDNKRVPMGIYIVYIECFNLKGEVKRYKKTCVVAEKL